MGLLYSYILNYISTTTEGIAPLPHDFFITTDLDGILETGINPKYFNHNHYECIQLKDHEKNILTIIPEVVVNLKDNTDISNSIEDGFFRTIAKALLKNITNINDIRLGVLLNHNNIHWTSLVCYFNINQDEYNKLLNNFNTDKPISEQYDPDDLSYKDHVNKTLNYIKEKIKLTNLLNNLTICHYDSMGGANRRLTIFNQVVKSATNNIIKNNNGKIIKGRCSMQKGNTCGDHSVYNIIIAGLLGLNALENPKDSKLLRAISEYILTPAPKKSLDKNNAIRSKETHFLSDSINQIAIHLEQHTTTIIHGLMSLAYCWINRARSSN